MTNSRLTNGCQYPFVEEIVYQRIRRIRVILSEAKNLLDSSSSFPRGSTPQNDIIKQPRSGDIALP